MRFKSQFTAILLSSTVLIPLKTLGAAGDDVVNERPPVTAEELEAHWGVDCAASWRDLLRLVKGSKASGRCETTEYGGALRLCAAIHQPPGEQAPASCRDYRAVLEIGDAPCADLIAYLEKGEACSSNTSKLPEPLP